MLGEGSYAPVVRQWQMKERCLQSLAILLAGLFSAERPRSSESAMGLLAPNADQESTSDVSARSKKPQEQH